MPPAEPSVQFTKRTQASCSSKNIQKHWEQPPQSRELPRPRVPSKKLGYPALPDHFAALLLLGQHPCRPVLGARANFCVASPPRLPSVPPRAYLGSALRQTEQPLGPQFHRVWSGPATRSLLAGELHRVPQTSPASGAAPRLRLYGSTTALSCGAQ